MKNKKQNDKFKAVIFDIGGVLAYDVWESMFLDEEKGIISIYNLSPEQLINVGQILWDKYSILSAENNADIYDLEVSYWKDFCSAFNLNTPIDDLIRISKQFIIPINSMFSLLTRLKKVDIKLAICSNNTEFWFNRQQQKINLNQIFRPENIILSSRVGYSKDNPNNAMYHAVITNLELNSEECLFIDDRNENIQSGIEYGFTSILFPSHAEFGSKYLTKIIHEFGIIKQ